MPSLVIRVDPERRQWWKSTLQELLPRFEIFLWDEDHYERSSIEYAVVWMPPLGGLAQLPNLRCVFSVGAGVSHILRDPEYPRHVPIVRTINEDLRKRMCEFVALHVLRFHRRLPEIEAAHRAARWTQYVEPLAREFPVGILGLGNLGAAVAKTLIQIGYPILGWSRRGRPIEGIAVYMDEEGLESVLKNSKVVVCMLPGTEATNELLNLERLSMMSPGCYLINVGRGETLAESALAQALRSGHLGGAVLDVFRKEPLPPEDPHWTLPNLLVTCHTASAIEPATGGRVISENILAFEAGEQVPDIVDLEQGY